MRRPRSACGLTRWKATYAATMPHTSQRYVRVPRRHRSHYPQCRPGTGPVRPADPPKVRLLGSLASALFPFLVCVVRSAVLNAQEWATRSCSASSRRGDCGGSLSAGKCHAARQRPTRLWNDHFWLEPERAVGVCNDTASPWQPQRGTSCLTTCLSTVAVELSRDGEGCHYRIDAAVHKVAGQQSRTPYEYFPGGRVGSRLRKVRVEW